MKTPTINRTYIAKDATLVTFADVEPYFNELLSRNLNDLAAYEKWLENISELDAFLEENGAWRYIKMSIEIGRAHV